MRTIVIHADTLCRRFLQQYGCDWTFTPNITRLAEKSTIFDNHWCGSSPCMPARRDLMTGRMSFLERSWGGIEPFDETLPSVLRREKGVFSHIVTDHVGYFIIGGENYMTQYNTYDMIRGQSIDCRVSLVNSPKRPATHGPFVDQYAKNMLAHEEEKDFPTPMVFSGAVDWIEKNKDADNYLLWVEAFDPHEPFDTPREYLDMYGDDYEGDLYLWPEYAECGDTPEQLAHIRRRYAATLTMMDRWLGKLLDAMDGNDMWKNTMVVFTTDHGLMLGEHGYMGKNYMPPYNELYHIPLFIYHPEISPISPGRRVSSLTQAPDIFTTILENYGIDASACRNPLHGKSLFPLLRGKEDKLRDAIIYGSYGLSVAVNDGDFVYIRAAQNADNKPLNLYTAMLTTHSQYYGIDAIIDPSKIEMGRFLSWTSFPVYKIPSEIIKHIIGTMSFGERSRHNDRSMLFDIIADYGQDNPVENEKTENEYISLLKRAMSEHEAPKEQFERLGIE